MDRIFDAEKFAENALYLPAFGVCAELSSLEAGTSIDLAARDGSDAQSFVVAGEGTITPAAAPQMCLTVAEDTRTGRSDANQIEVLSLEPCDDGRSAGVSDLMAERLGDAAANRTVRRPLADRAPTIAFSAPRGPRSRPRRSSKGSARASSSRRRDRTPP